MSITGLFLTASSLWLEGQGYVFLNTVHALTVILGLMYIPFGKLFHIFQRPANLGVHFYRDEAAAGEAQTCRVCGEGFASVLQIEDLKTVLPQVGFDYSINPANGDGPSGQAGDASNSATNAGDNWRHTCPLCRRRQVALTQTDVDLFGLVLDMTNFATYIDTSNDRAPIAQRGHAKQKRTDLRLVGLGLIVSTDHAIPLLSHAYDGSRPDVTQFADMVTVLVDRFDKLGADTDDFTLVYDAGQNSQSNQTIIANSPLHFVGSLPPSDHPDLLAIDTAQFAPVDGDRFAGLTAYATTKIVYDAEHRIVVTHSQNLHDKQSRGFDQTLNKARRLLADLAARLARGRTCRSRDAVEAEIARICAPRWLNRVISTTLTGDKPAELRLRWRTKPAARRALETELFGKRILFTDRHNWSIAQIVAAYRSQSHVEADFQQMKDPHVVSFSPMHHWTDPKIRVHSFYCVLALTVARLMVREADRTGLHMSVRELLDTLAGIQETVLLYQGDRGRPRARRMLTQTSPTQDALYALFGLDAYAPTR